MVLFILLTWEDIKNQKFLESDNTVQGGNMAASENSVVLFVGPKGSSDERVAEKFFEGEPESVLPILTLENLVTTVDMTPGTVGVLPLEDDIRGEFHASYDALIELTNSSVVIQATTLKETIFLQGLDPNKKPDVVYSHPDILAKYSTFFLESGIETVATANTSIACMGVRERGNPFHCALAPSVVGERYGLKRLENISYSDAVIQTRYGLLGRMQKKNSETRYASILYVQPQDDRSGTLLEILDAFRQENVNLRRLRSQSTGPGMPHGFVVELDGHPSDPNVGFALMVLLSQNVGLKILGVFPAAPEALSPEKNVQPSALLLGESALETAIFGG